jgi:hypothetical protein
MQRVSDQDVKEIIATQLNTQPFIQLATLLVDQYLLNKGIAEALLTEIERWWAAHLVCVREPRLKDARTDGDAMSWQRGAAGKGLASTDYGQQVLALDPTGTLATVTTTKRASFNVD